jgi:hypothetical protein
MSYDPVDVWGGALAAIFRRAFLFAAAVWAGTLLGGMALAAGNLAAGGFLEHGLQLIFASPLLLVSLWGIPNLFVLLVGVVFFVRSENAAYAAWIILAGIESLVVMLGWAGDFSGWWPRTAAWASWVVLLTMAAAGVFVLRQWQINRWALHMARVEAEIVRKRAEIEARQAGR